MNRREEALNLLTQERAGLDTAIAALLAIEARSGATAVKAGIPGRPDIISRSPAQDGRGSP